MRVSTLAFVASTLAPCVLGHGQVHKIYTATTTYVAADAYAAADATSPIRKLNTYGPAASMTGPDIVCGPGGNTPVSNLAPVVAGTEITFDWTSWSSVHPGPLMTYIAACTGGCANFKGDTGNIWVKIDHDGYVGTRTPQPWAEETLRIETEQTYTVTIPASIPNGEYLVRHEILGLHVASQVNGAQFYPNCIQISVTGGGGTALPTGVAFPGEYQPNDPSILMQLYTVTPSNPSYVIPGGPVLLNGSSAQRYYSGNPPQSGPKPPPASSSSTKAVGTTTSAKPGTTTSAKPVTTTSSATGPAATAYAQCGGTNWTGATTCVSGYTCKYSSAYYSQCLPS